MAFCECEITKIVLNLATFELIICFSQRNFVFLHKIKRIQRPSNNSMLCVFALSLSPKQKTDKYENKE